MTADLTPEGLDVLVADAELAIKAMAETGTFETGQGIIRDLIVALIALRARAEKAEARDRALEEAAAVAEPRVRRWREIEPPFNGTLDEAIEAVEGIAPAILALRKGAGHG